MKAPMRISPSQVTRADKSLRTALTFIDEHILRDIRAKKANPTPRWRSRHDTIGNGEMNSSSPCFGRWTSSRNITRACRA